MQRDPKQLRDFDEEIREQLAAIEADETLKAAIYMTWGVTFDNYKMLKAITKQLSEDRIGAE